jgi:hypothetical protein
MANPGYPSIEEFRQDPVTLDISRGPSMQQWFEFIKMPGIDGAPSLSTALTNLIFKIPPDDDDDEHKAIAQILYITPQLKKLQIRGEGDRCDWLHMMPVLRNALSDALAVKRLKDDRMLTELKLYNIRGIPTTVLPHLSAATKLLVLDSVTLDLDVFTTPHPLQQSTFAVIDLITGAFNILTDPHTRPFFAESLERLTWRHYPGQDLSVLSDSAGALQSLYCHICPMQGAILLFFFWRPSRLTSSLLLTTIYYGFPELPLLPSVVDFAIIIDIDNSWSRSILSPAILGIIEQLPSCLPQMHHLQIRAHSRLGIDPPVTADELDAVGFTAVLEEVDAMLASHSCLRQVRWGMPGTEADCRVFCSYFGNCLHMVDKTATLMLGVYDRDEFREI